LALQILLWLDAATAYIQLSISQWRFLSISYISTVYISTLFIFQRQDISTPLLLRNFTTKYEANTCLALPPAFGARIFSTVITTSMVQDLNEKITPNKLDLSIIMYN
jgi:hypothetical protein